MSYLADHIQAMRGYTYGEQPSDLSVVKLNTNENPYPPSPVVREVLANLDLDELRRYPDATSSALRDRIAAEYGLRSEQVLITNGGDEAIRLVATACLTPNSVLISTEPGYSLYLVIASVLNARYIPMQLGHDFRPDPTAANRCIAQHARLVCIPNPNSPSGVLMSVDEVDAFAAQFPGPLLIDEAYVDFVEPDLKHDLVPLLSNHRNLLLLRTFSKGYSLAGARVGYLLGEESFISALSEKVRDSYNVNCVSQAMALAAFSDIAHARETWDAVRTERQRLTTALRNGGFNVPNSQANFVLPQRNDRTSMSATYERLRMRNILVRYFKTPRLHDRLRVTVGSSSENDAFLEALFTC
ncbi:MAG: histidinol-phosphate transaminase [Gammaproteobacteria bacterium]|nr:histidinol-phosphate transaminase [Gammaproteobacteria bacterium]